MNEVVDLKRHNKTWKRSFILALREHGIPALAAKETGVRMSRVRDAKKNDPRFLEYFNEAIEIANAELEHNARLQAMSGSERIMIKLLEGNIPEKYAKVEQNTSNTFVKAYIGFSPDLWDQDVVEGETVAKAALEATPALLGDNERDTDNSDVQAVAMASQTPA